MGIELRKLTEHTEVLKMENARVRRKRNKTNQIKEKQQKAAVEFPAAALLRAGLSVLAEAHGSAVPRGVSSGEQVRSAAIAPRPALQPATAESQRPQLSSSSNAAPPCPFFFYVWFLVS